MITIKRKPDFKKDMYEDAAWQANRFVAGIDEVGRGCLAGPVVAAAVILFPHKKSRLIKDSKLLDKEGLQKGYNWIVKNSWYSIGIAHHRDINRLNIYGATLYAMRRAVMQLLTTAPQKPNQILIDAMPLALETFEGDIIHFAKGERKSSSIAAASIIAKVTRDKLMQEIEYAFPGYGLAQHKGYSTPLHKQMLKERGVSIIHRTAFTSWLDDQYEQQESLLDE